MQAIYFLLLYKEKLLHDPLSKNHHFRHFKNASIRLFYGIKIYKLHRRDMIIITAINQTTGDNNKWKSKSKLRVSIMLISTRAANAPYMIEKKNKLLTTCCCCCVIIDFVYFCNHQLTAQMIREEKIIFEMLEWTGAECTRELCLLEWSIMGKMFDQYIHAQLQSFSLLLHGAPSNFGSIKFSRTTWFIRNS